MSKSSDRQATPQGNEEPTDERLWSWVDRAAPELDEYIAANPEAKARVDELRGAIAQFEKADPAQSMPERVGEYRIKRVLGRGGMGCVYEAEQEHPSRSVALKVLPLEVVGDERRTELFKREATALARLCHPGIAVIYSVGQGKEGHPHIAMELLEGRTLDLYSRENSLGRRAKITLARRVCEAIGHAHENGIVHRDIKPTNIIVDEAGKPVVIDFGLARIADDGLTRASLHGSVLGTLPYMSPEQVSGSAEVGPASDVYSLGVVLFELLTGRLPYDLTGLSLIEAARKIESQTPVMPRGIRRSLRGELRTVVLKALEKHPSRRYQDAGELASELGRVLEGYPVLAQPPTVAKRVSRFVLRHWAGTLVSTSVLMLVLLIILPFRIPIPIVGAWWSEASPFEDVRWMRDSPEVLIEGRWYALVEIDDLPSAYVVGFCQENSARVWRKRFSEDLVQVLNRLGHWGTGEVDLKLRDLESGRLVMIRDVPMSSDRRQTIRNNRHAWPWIGERSVLTEKPVSFEGETWKLVSIDGAPIEELAGGSLYDSYCDRFGHSPGEVVDFTLRNVSTGELLHHSEVPRLGSQESEGL